MNSRFIVSTLMLTSAVAACNGSVEETVLEEAAPVAVEEAKADVSVEAPVDAMDGVLAGAWRGENGVRDGFRHPKETLAFFGVEPDMTVVEISPGGGWYAEVIAPYLATGGGKYIAAGSDIDQLPDRYKPRAQAFRDKFSDTEIFGDVEYAIFAKDAGDILSEGNADVVLTFRNVHNWMRGEWDQKAFNDMANALKPGGVLGVVEHRAKTDVPQDPIAENGYVREDYVIELASKAGLLFEGRSEVNANPNDTADHPYGVWTLPPRSYTGGENDEPMSEEDQAKYKAIGESDRMTLKFTKPVE